MDALFDSLVRLHPVTLEPTAALATHYERSADAQRYVFYLRGNPHPRGIKLPNTDDLREQFRTGKIKDDLARGHSAPPDSVPARWSDGRTITARDFVYSWRRLFSPKTGAPYAQFSTYLLHSAEILAGKRPTNELGVRALDDWTLEVLLERPNDFFLTLLDSSTFYPVPRHVIEAAESRGQPRSWTEAGHIVTSGAYQLGEWLPYEKLTARKNPNYWEADLTGLDEIVFLPITDNLTNLNLYRSGEADFLTIPPAFKLALKRMRDHQEVFGGGVQFLQINTRQPPLDNVLLRYALNLATDKKQVAKLYMGAQQPARTFGIPTMGYQPPASIFVNVRGRVYDVSSYDPAAARELLGMAGFRGGKKSNGDRLRIDFSYSPSAGVGDDLAAVLSRQWQENLGIELSATKLDSSRFAGLIGAGRYPGVALWGWVPRPEPAMFMDVFFSSEHGGGMFWEPAAFRKTIEQAKNSVGRPTRLKKVADADRMIMEGMPLIPLVYLAWDFMVKPYLKGLPLNSALDLRFKYAYVEIQ